MICSTEEEEEFRLLLLRMLAPIRRSHETPLQFEIDSLSIAEAAWASFSKNCKTLSLEAPWEPALVISKLEALMGRIRTDEEMVPPSMVTALANWLDCLFRKLREIDPEAIEIAGLRVEGLDNRSISEKLETGLRLVDSIIEDIGDFGASEPERKEAGKPC